MWHFTVRHFPIHRFKFFISPPNSLTLKNPALADSDFVGSFAFSDTFGTTDEGTKGYGYFLLQTVRPGNSNILARLATPLSGAVILEATP